MKRFLAVPLAMLVAAVAAPASAAVKVVTSLQDFASIADAVGGKRVETFALAKGYQDPHFVEPRPSFVLNALNLLLHGIRVAGWDGHPTTIGAGMSMPRSKRIFREPSPGAFGNKNDVDENRVPEYMVG